VILLPLKSLSKKQKQMLKIIIKTILCSLLVCFYSCKEEPILVTLTNDLSIERTSETIEINLQELKEHSFFKDLKSIAVKDQQDHTVMHQLLDVNQDSIFDYLIFQTNFNPKERKSFSIVFSDDIIVSKKPENYSFCRFVPERIDDFAWENDKVAFRTYGPKCQNMFENNIAGGLVSSGIDCWTKKVDKPIINKWYKDYLNGKTYHKDYGEGLDAYHVGATRGCGGVALLDNDNNKIVSENFKNHIIIANGPIRSIFDLKYPSTSVNGVSVTETKRISIDLGSNLYKCTISYNNLPEDNLAAIGLTYHKGNGKLTKNISKGWLSYKEPYQNSFLNTAILTNPKNIDFIKDTIDVKKDESKNNFWIHSKIKNQKLEYWAGFFWMASKQFENEAKWTKYLSDKAQKMENPIRIEIKH